ncbi:jg12452 [Pararge aegeria aegeria]|uniref:Jg12452 protein n=1 Tax=Pararge aegeria aegeria TaxID=348720 RepID=A0A8S4RQG9_9NEOP|nr:jg12452 [Pararge aegeria aegeria]
MLLSGRNKHGNGTSFDDKKPLLLPNTVAEVVRSQKYLLTLENSAVKQTDIAGSNLTVGVIESRRFYSELSELRNSSGWVTHIALRTEGLWDPKVLEWRTRWPDNIKEIARSRWKQAIQLAIPLNTQKTFGQGSRARNLLTICTVSRTTAFCIREKLLEMYPDYRYQGRRKMGGHSRPLRCGSERKKQNASYVLMVFQPRNGADSFGASQFDGRKEMV